MSVTQDVAALQRLLAKIDNTADVLGQWLKAAYVQGWEDGYANGYADARSEFQPRENEQGTASSWSGVDQEGRK